MRHYYENPLMLVEGAMQYVYDETGRRYLDAFGGIVTVSVGHCHPKVTDAATEQLETLQHASTLYLHPAVGAYAEALAAKFPEPLKVVYFVNSGSEANDLAIIMARLYTSILTSSACATDSMERVPVNGLGTPSVPIRAMSLSPTWSPTTLDRV
jgi:alanine-glyoxylate transaminase / (R)-3-amino-2-methylpropionate-pyruvate transaminase